MPSSLGVVYLVGVTAAVLMFAYAAYWGFSIRRALYVRVYRNQALGVGLVAVSFGILSLVLAASTYSIPGHVNPGPAASPFLALALLTLLYWIDTSMLAARRSDPLLRDTLHWKKLRVVFWAGNILALGFLVSVAAYFLGLSALGEPLPGAAGAAPPPSAIPIILAPFLLTGVAGLLLLIAGRRSKDTNLQRSLRWFALFAASLLVGLVSAAAQFIGPLVTVEYAAPMVYTAGALVGGYFLYRSAKALVPLNRIESGDLDADSRLKLGAIASRAGWLNTLTRLVSHLVKYACCQIRTLRRGFA